MTKIGICPFCQSRDPILFGLRGIFAVICNDCRANGPTITSKREAIDRWNAVSVAVQNQKEINNV